ncbi:MAG: glycerol-3-phosphate dehydrogenase/oxidase [Longimicrobiaceae bacterium]
MWHGDWRDRLWSRLSEPWDLLVIGGGITGAGILAEATGMGLRALLVEQHDFAWGTSSRSSKLVHGGLRYLSSGQLQLTRRAVREREALLREAPGLVSSLGFLLATYHGERPGRWTYSAGLSLYELLAGRWDYRRYEAEDFLGLAPHIARERLEGGFRFGDAQTDDARLVLRLLREAVSAGGAALNYVRAEELLREQGEVCGARLRDARSGRTAEVRARVVVNATGAWADRLRAQVGGTARMRALRGSHLIFPAWRLPLAQAFSFLHPVDRRPVFAFPWEGVTLVGTTDVDHADSLDAEPRISGAEVAYLMRALDAYFPSLGLETSDVLSTFAGVRPVIGGSAADPSCESRDHAIWSEEGLLTVAGGKLTTFRPIARELLLAARHRLPELTAQRAERPALTPGPVELPGAERLDRAARLLGRYGAEAAALLAAALPEELEPIPGTPVLWAELRWCARAEGVVHLDDLLLRRVRLGLLLPEGGRQLLPSLRALCQPELGWDDARWEAEEERYLALWREHYSLPAPESIPEWRGPISDSAPAAAPQEASRYQIGARGAVGIGTVALASVLLLHRLRSAYGSR